jgi:hypothetical protein
MDTLLSLHSVFSPTRVRLVRDVKPLSDFIHIQLEQFRSLSNYYAIWFCYETLKTPLPGGTSVVVVPRASAVIDGDRDIRELALPKDHIGIAKPNSMSDSAFRMLARVFEDLARSGNARCEERWTRYSGVKFLLAIDGMHSYLEQACTCVLSWSLLAAI